MATLVDPRAAHRPQFRQALSLAQAHLRALRSRRYVPPGNSFDRDTDLAQASPTCTAPAEDALCPFGSDPEVRQGSDGLHYLISCYQRTGGANVGLGSVEVSSLDSIGQCIAECIAYNVQAASQGAYQPCEYGQIENYAAPTAYCSLWGDIRWNDDVDDGRVSGNIGKASFILTSNAAAINALCPNASPSSSTSTATLLTSSSTSSSLSSSSSTSSSTSSSSSSSSSASSSSSSSSSSASCPDDHAENATNDNPGYSFLHWVRRERSLPSRRGSSPTCGRLIILDHGLRRFLSLDWQLHLQRFCLRL